jgi:prephenate dehydrogenase
LTFFDFFVLLFTYKQLFSFFLLLILNILRKDILFPFKEVWIFGLGLLGGSIAKKIKRCYPNIKVYAVGRKEKNIDFSVDYNVLDDYFTYNKISGISGIAVICTPVDTIAEIFSSINKKVGKDAIITDVGSTKLNIVKEVSAYDDKNCFIGSHPMAGSEKCGFEHSRADLFENKKVVVTPGKNADISKLNKLKIFWEMLGANVIETSPEIHDEITGLTSHSVHIISSLLTKLLADNERYDGNYLSIFGNGLLDTTRVAAGNEEIWSAICAHNKENIVKNLTEFKNKLQILINSIKDLHLQDLNEFFKEARAFREKLDIGKDFKP